jgi:hypothetical protein
MPEESDRRALLISRGESPKPSGLSSDRGGWTWNQRPSGLKSPTPSLGTTAGTTRPAPPHSRRPQNREGPPVKRPFAKSGRLDLNQRPPGPCREAVGGCVPERPPRPRPWTFWTHQSVPKWYHGRCRFESGARFVPRYDPRIVERAGLAVVGQLRRDRAACPRCSGSVEGVLAVTSGRGPSREATGYACFKNARR